MVFLHAISNRKYVYTIEKINFKCILSMSVLYVSALFGNSFYPGVFLCGVYCTIINALFALLIHYQNNISTLKRHFDNP